MEELTESARQCLVSQGIVIGTLSVLNSLGLLLAGVVVIARANDILRFTSLTHLAILEVACGLFSLLAIAYVCWIVAAYRNRQLEIRSKYLDEKMSRGLIAVILTILISFSALVVSGIFLMLKIDASSTYDLKSAMSLYAVDCTRKVVIDKLQMLFECCGSLSLLDWFLVDWQNADLEPGDHILNMITVGLRILTTANHYIMITCWGETLSDWDSVPFSCCNPEAPPPCVHHQLRAFGVGSLYTNGCADKLDEAVFFFVLLALIMLFLSTFLMMIILYISRKLQTSARSAVIKGDATAPGGWWLLSPAGSIHSNEFDQFTPLLDKPRNKTPKRNKSSKPVVDYWCQSSRENRNPFHKNTKIRESTENEDWDTYKTESKNLDGDSSEDWTRRANDASESTSSTTFLSTTRPINSTPETRHSVSDTAVANLEVSHHFEHKVRPLYRS